MSRQYITLKGLKRLSVTIILRLGTLLGHNQTSGKQRLPPPASQRKQISKYVNSVTTRRGSQDINIKHYEFTLPCPWHYHLHRMSVFTLETIFLWKVCKWVSHKNFVFSSDRSSTSSSVCQSFCDFYKFLTQTSSCLQGSLRVLLGVSQVSQRALSASQQPLRLSRVTQQSLRHTVIHTDGAQNTRLVILTSNLYSEGDIQSVDQWSCLWMVRLIKFYFNISSALCWVLLWVCVPCFWNFGDQRWWISRVFVSNNPRDANFTENQARAASCKIWILAPDFVGFWRQRWGGAWPSDQEGTPETSIILGHRDTGLTGGVHITPDTNGDQNSFVNGWILLIGNKALENDVLASFVLVEVLILRRTYSLWTPLPLECQALPSINRKYDQFPPAQPQTHSPVAAKSIQNIMKFNKNFPSPLPLLTKPSPVAVMLNSEMWD